jgi:membrane associated rhomboid family serine protease
VLPVGTDIEIKKFPRTTLSLIGINIFVFIGELLLPPKSLNWVFDQFGFGAFTRNPFTLLSSLFLHGDIFHIVGNMVFLWIFGPPVEERIGARKFVYYYFGAGLWSTALWVVMEQLARPGSHGTVIGASGAISGVIALYLYRCFYSKLKMVVDPLFLPWKVHIPAAPLIIFWFLRDMLGGIASLSQSTGVAHWGHVGGFFFGLAVARIKRYGHEGRLEHAKGRLLSKLQAGDGWKSVDAEKELLKLLKIVPNDPEVHHQLAQFYSARQRTKEAAEHYRFAVQRYFLTNPLHGAFTVIEHMEGLKKPMAGHYHLKAAETLSQAGWTEEAYKVVRPLMGKEAVDAITEKAHVIFVKLCLALHQREEAEDAARIFAEKHPKSRYRADVQKALSLRPEDLFPPGKEEPAASAPIPDGEREEAPAGKGLTALAFSARTVTDPLFFFLWLVVIMVLQFGALLQGTTAYEYFWKLPLTAFVTAFAMTTIFRTPWAELFRYANRQSEKDARKEVDLSMTANRAKLAERGENFEKAADLYEKLLALDPKDIQARFNLARIYHHKLNDQGKARRHYRELLKYAPPEHPYFHEAESAIRTSGPK